MKKLVFFASAFVVGVVFADHLYAGTYVSGSVSTMMNSNIGWNGNASTNKQYYLINCPAMNDFCNGSNLKWSATDKQSVDVKLDKKMMFSGAFGYFNKKKPFRFEIEYSNISNTVKSATYQITHGANLSTLNYDFSGDNLTLNSLMGNAYYTMKVDSFRPYMGVGVGYISGKMSFIHRGSPINIGAGFGFQFMLGAEVPVQKSLYVGAEFRHLNFGMLDATDSYLGQSNKLKKGNSSGLLLKVRYELEQHKGNKKNCKSGKCRTRRRNTSNRYSRDEYYY